MILLLDFNSIPRNFENQYVIVRLFQQVIWFSYQAVYKAYTRICSSFRSIMFRVILRGSKNQVINIWVNS